MLGYLLGFCIILEANLPRDFLDLVLREARSHHWRERALDWRDKSKLQNREDLKLSCFHLLNFLLLLFILFKYYLDHHNHVPYEYV